MEGRVAPPKTVTVSSEGGWCNDFRFAGGATPYTVLQAPQHGELQQHIDGGWKIISYRPAARYSGPDSFELLWLSPNIHMVYNITAVP